MRILCAEFVPESIRDPSCGSAPHNLLNIANTLNGQSGRFYTEPTMATACLNICEWHLNSADAAGKENWKSGRMGNDPF